MVHCFFDGFFPIFHCVWQNYPAYFSALFPVYFSVLVQLFLRTLLSFFGALAQLLSLFRRIDLTNVMAFVQLILASLTSLF